MDLLMCKFLLIGRYRKQIKYNRLKTEWLYGGKKNEARWIEKC